jgi:YVTN family beta-propeller protein
VGWDLVDHDVAVIEASTLSVSYVRHLMNLCMALAVDPVSGQIAVVGTDAVNEVRFEPNLNGRFLRVKLALLPAGAPAAAAVSDLNPHLTYASASVPPALRTLSLGDPRGIVWNAVGTRTYVAGMGSNTVVTLDASGARVAPPVEVGEGPTGLALDDSRRRLYVLDKFEAAISVIDTDAGAELTRVPFHDPTPSAIRAGRPHLYDTRATSGLGHVACASCHPDARMDRLAWDLGNPAEPMIPFDQNCNFGFSLLGPGPCPDWHPMKGPMVTQTLQDIIGKEPHHWRGDRDGLEEFNQTFVNLQGADALLPPAHVQALEDFLATIAFPPNPFRNRNNTLPTALLLPGHVFTGIGGAPGQPLPAGSAVFGVGIFENHHLVTGFQVSCNQCHTQPTGIGTNLSFEGGSGQDVPPGPNGELHHAVVFSPLSEAPDLGMDVPQLRNLHEKVGFDLMSTTSRAGFGF